MSFEIGRRGRGPIIVASITQSSCAYAIATASRCREAGFAAEADVRALKINKKVAKHLAAGVKVLLLVGDAEREDGTITWRGQYQDDQTILSIESLIEILKRG